MPALLVALLLLAQASPPSRADIVGPARVIDGDTIEIQGLKVRLHGIDAPEHPQTCQKDGREWLCGDAATNALDALVRGLRVECWIKDRDIYGRFVAVCTAAGKDIAGQMVEMGWALAYRRYSHVYVETEARAKVAGLGMWAGEFMPPWDWRKRMRDAE
jgi:endonuclease YncB( thermonuclease family)